MPSFAYRTLACLAAQRTRAPIPHLRHSCLRRMRRAQNGIIGVARKTGWRGAVRGFGARNAPGC